MISARIYHESTHHRIALHPIDLLSKVNLVDTQGRKFHDFYSVYFVVYLRRLILFNDHSLKRAKCFS